MKKLIAGLLMATATPALAQYATKTSLNNIQIQAVQDSSEVLVSPSELSTVIGSSSPNISGTSINVTSTTAPYQYGGNVVMRFPLDGTSEYATLIGRGAASGSNGSGINSWLATCIGTSSCGAGGAGMTGVENTMVGWNAGNKFTTAAYNAGYGVNVMGVQSTGNNNAFFGMDAARDVDGVDDSVGVGAHAGRNNCGDRFVAVGARALWVGSGTTCIGSANDIIAVGTDSVSSASLTSAARGVGVGNYTGKSVITATDWVYIGHNAGQGATGSNNLAVGASAFSANSNGAVQEVCIGKDACLVKTAGFDDVVIGYQAGKALTNANQNTILGSKAAATLTTGNTNILVGYNIDTPATNTSNYVNIGGALIGYATAPTATSGFGTSPTVTGASSFAFRITVGASGSPSTTTVVTFGTAPNGWNCTVQDMTTAVTARQSASSTTTATHTWSVAPSNSDVLLYQCGAL